MLTHQIDINNKQREYDLAYGNDEELYSHSSLWNYSTKLLRKTYSSPIDVKNLVWPIGCCIFPQAYMYPSASKTADYNTLLQTAISLVYPVLHLPFSASNQITESIYKCFVSRAVELENYLYSQVIYRQLKVVCRHTFIVVKSQPQWCLSKQTGLHLVHCAGTLSLNWLHR